MHHIRHLILVPGDQIDLKAAAFDGFDAAQDAVWMAEVHEESTHDALKQRQHPLIKQLLIYSRQFHKSSHGIHRSGYQRQWRHWQGSCASTLGPGPARCSGRAVILPFCKGP